MRESGRAAGMMKITEEEVKELETVLSGLESGLVTKKGSAVGLRDVIMKVKARGEEREVMTNFEYLKTLSIEDFISFDKFPVSFFAYKFIILNYYFSSDYCHYRITFYFHSLIRSIVYILMKH